MNISTKFDIRDRVVINGDKNLVAVIQRVMVAVLGENYGLAYEVVWFDSSGVFQERWMYEWQLELAE
jgi:hypothetical protein